MSVRATTAVWEHSQAKGPDLVLMLAIADAANSDGRNAFPGMDRLVKWCRVKSRAVQASIARQIECGELVRTAQGHRGQPAVYDVALPGLAAFEDYGKGAADDTQTDPERVQADAGKGAGARRERVQDGANAPLIELHEQEQHAARFEEFWKAYPERHGRKVDKAKARQVWDKLPQADRVAAFVAVRHYAQSCRKGETFAKDAHRWLRDRSFADWATPAKGSSEQAAADVPRCPHRFPIVEDDDGFTSSGCPDCEVDILERAVTRWREGRAS